MKITNSNPPTFSISASNTAIEKPKTVQVFIGDQAVTFGIGKGEQRKRAQVFLSGNKMSAEVKNHNPTFTSATGEQKVGAQTGILRLKK